MCKPKVEIIEHTADLAILISAKDYYELFSCAPSVLYSIIGHIEINECTNPQEETISLQAGNKEELFHDWLTEILYYFEVRQLIFEECLFSVLKAERLESHIKSRKIDIHKSKIITEIKAVTYHDLKIEEKDGNIQARVIFDV